MVHLKHLVKWNSVSFTDGPCNPALGAAEAGGSQITAQPWQFSNSVRYKMNKKGAEDVRL